MEKLNDSFNKEKSKFSIKEENIIALEKLMNYPNNKELFEAFNWPLEIQGSGRIIENNNFEIKYPKGDKFFSYAIIIHELGHLRQDELIYLNYGTNIETEIDAFSRGWNRVFKYYPELIEKLESQFQEYKKQSKIEDFDSFKDLFDFLKGTININLSLEKVGDNCSAEEKIVALKQAGVDKFFDKINKNKVGELINEQEAKDFIIKVSTVIAKEQL